MRRLSLAVLVTASVLAVAAQAQDKGDKGQPGNDASAVTSGSAVGGPASQDAPNPNDAPLAGDKLADGKVSRQNLFPLDDKRTWTYTIRTWLVPTDTGEDNPPELKKPRTYTEEVEVAPTQQINGKDARVLEYKLSGEHAQFAYYIQDGQRLLCTRRILGAGDHKHSFDLDPPQADLDGALPVGATWSWTGKVGPTDGEMHFTVIRDEALTVPAGKFEPVVIKSTFSGNDDSTGCSVKWLAPDVGIVRELTEVKSDQQLIRTEAVLTDWKPRK